MWCRDWELKLQFPVEKKITFDVFSNFTACKKIFDLQFLDTALYLQSFNANKFFPGPDKNVLLKLQNF